MPPSPNSPEEELKETLLLYLQTNRNFIEEKIYKEFAVECLQQHQLKSIDTKKMKQTIEFIFDFGSNKEMTPFYEKLQFNIKKYIDEEENKAVPKADEKVTMELDNLIEMIDYCVNNGFANKKVETVAVEKIQKDVSKSKVPQKKQKKVLEPQPPKPKPPKTQINITKLNPKLEQKVGKMKLVIKPFQSIKANSKVENKLDPSKIPKASEFYIQRHQVPNYNKAVVPKYLQSDQTQTKKEPEPEIDYKAVYQPISAEALRDIALQKVMKERLFEIYRHYCSQLQHLGKNPTFDRMKDEMEKMSLGKFLTFCKNTVAFGKPALNMAGKEQANPSKKSAKYLGKTELTNSFKKVAEGKAEISFEQFQKLLERLDKKFVQVLESIEEKHQKNNEKRPLQKQEEKIKTSNFPSYQARLFLQDGQKYKDCKKNLVMIFYTRDNKNYDNKLTISNFDKRDLTSHSGKTGKQLKLDLKERYNRDEVNTIESMESSRNSSSSRMVNKHNRASTLFESINGQVSPSQSKSKKAPKKISLEEISIGQWPRIQWLEEEVNNEDMEKQNVNNKIYNKGRRKDVVGNLRKRVEEISKLDAHNY